ncbi:hypothetical protein BUALT_Bualt04G0130200 [Buddleja alternifolia]|uniref:WIT1/2 N-terminal helical bundle domain-containing protein n=1 Tax=Buddleja alternifolia TaxID=168488 RepID=A0AAV6XWR6_9LAMI|nr:hypothetical protein BUALT_Bualt04G0130200 [Buddleja alternifolia]
MGSDSVQDGPSIENAGSSEVEADSNNIDSLDVVSSGGDTTRELQSAAETLTRVELDLACSSEKLVNLDILVMHVASRENDFEAFALEEELLEGSVEKALEFDLLYGVLDSEVREVDTFLSALQTEIISSKRVISSFKQLGDAVKEMEEKLQDCEECLKQSFEQISDIKMQSANFRRILLASSGDEKWKDDKELASSENGSLSDSNAKIKMQTAEQQRNILRMLEKSLAREMDLEKKLTESRQTEEDLRLRLQQEVFCMEEEAEDMWERLFEAENSAEILLGSSKELFGRMQMAHFTINGSTQIEAELRSKLQDVNEQLKEKDRKLSEYESQLRDVKNLAEQNKELKVKAIEAEKRVEQLETLLKDSEIKLLHASASAEATQEKQNMLDCTIKDMENLIQDLKSKVSKAESQTESAEEKCIILSESNAELIEELNFLRHRLQCLETSLHQADEAKKETAKDIRIRTKLIADLVMQLALERERLHKQISSLIKERRVTVKYLQQIKKDSSVTTIGGHDGKVKRPMPSENEIKSGTSTKRSDEEKLGSSATSAEIGNAPRDLLTTETEMGHGDNSNHNTVRNIDARQLGFKYVFLIVLVLVIIAVFAAFLFQQ